MADKKNSAEEKKDIGLYEKLAERSRAFIKEAEEQTVKAVGIAIDKAKEEMVAAGDFSHEHGERLKTFLQRDLFLSLRDVSKAEDVAKEVLEPHRVLAGIQGLMASTLETVGEKLEDWAAKLEKDLNFKTGEITAPGTLTCKKCQKKIKMHKMGHIPPCPECCGTEFHKGY
ncbi:MAG: hypothetical protein KAS94_08990 [Desulfobulbaceae bacterium]|nr:hypothetical protein [Desulfobulbaceae bacterium]